MNKLLEKQIKKYLSENTQQQEEVLRFITAVNNSYNAYERDQSLSAHAFSISEQEYTNINNKLKEEVALKREGIKNLKEAIKSIEDADDKEFSIDINEDNLLDTYLYLKQQIVKRRRVERELKKSEFRFSAAANRFSQLIAHLHNGIMVEDEHRNIVLANHLFCDIFQLNQQPSQLIGTNCEDAVLKERFLFKDPDGFLLRLNEVLNNKKLVAGDELETIDGRILLRDYVPIFVDNNYKGHLWKYEDVTKQKENQNELHRLSLVASANENGVLFTKPDGPVFWSNDGFCKMTGYTHEEVIGKTPLDLCRGPLTDKQALIEMIEAFTTGKTFNIELIHYRKDKSWFWGRVKGQAILSEEGEVLQYFAMLEDITYERDREEQLNLLSLIAKENINAVVISDKEGKIEWVNDSFSRMSGYSLDEIKGQTPDQLLHGEETDPEVVKELRQKIQAGEVVNCEILNYSKEGKKYWICLQLQAIKNSKGEIIKYFALQEDITERKLAKEKLRESEMMWQFALEGAGDGVWEYNFKTGKYFYSKQYKKMLGFEDDEFANNSQAWLSRVHPDDIKIIEDTDAAYFNGRIANHHREYRMMNKQGNYMWILDRGMVMSYSENGLPERIVGTHTDITERKYTEQALKINEEKYRNIIANMNLGLLEVDMEENIQFANHSFCEMCGYTLDELVGKKASAIFAQGRSRVLLENKTITRKTGISDAYEVAVKNKRGEGKWWLVSGAPRYTDNGELIGSIGIHLDITEQKQLQLDLIDARELAEESSRSKESFLANMSHEIRTPMNAIIGMSRQLQKTALNDRQHFFLDTIFSAAENLLVVINDILDISKVEAGRLTLEEIGFRLKDVMYRVMQVMSHKAEEKGLKFSCELDDTIFPVLMGDPHRLNQVLLNIISNSIKFTEKGRVTIDCRVEDGASYKQVICIRIADTCIGMDQEFLKNLFQPFLQEDKTTARKYGGTGLGMAISKQLVELMGGEITVESQKGIGTTTTIRIPFIIGSEDYLPKKENVTYDSATLKDKKILLVEDNEMNRLVATTVLNNYGAVITEVENGVKAIEAITESDYDLVLMDMQMPVMDGLEATTIIRREHSKTLPIIALTANAIKGESEKCINAGMNDYISKPFEEEELIKMIALWLNQRIEPMIKNTVTVNNAQLFDLSKLKEISRGNEAFVQKMLLLFVEQAPVSVKEIKDAYTIGDFAKIKSVAHRLKPSIDNLGINSLKNEIRQIESLALESQKNSNSEKLIDDLGVIMSEVVNQIKLL